MEQRRLKITQRPSPASTHITQWPTSASKHVTRTPNLQPRVFEHADINGDPLISRVEVEGMLAKALSALRTDSADQTDAMTARLHNVERAITKQIESLGHKTPAPTRAEDAPVTVGQLRELLAEVVKLARRQPGSSEITYDGMNRITGIRHSDGRSSRITYDGINRIARITHSGN